MILTRSTCLLFWERFLCLGVNYWDCNLILNRKLRCYKKMVKQVGKFCQEQAFLQNRKIVIVYYLTNLHRMLFHLCGLQNSVDVTDGETNLRKKWWKTEYRRQLVFTKHGMVSAKDSWFTNRLIAKCYELEIWLEWRIGFCFLSFLY